MFSNIAVAVWQTKCKARVARSSYRKPDFILYQASLVAGWTAETQDCESASLFQNFTQDWLSRVITVSTEHGQNHLIPNLQLRWLYSTRNYSKGGQITATPSNNECKGKQWVINVRYKTSMVDGAEQLSTIDFLKPCPASVRISLCPKQK